MRKEMFFNFLNKNKYDKYKIMKLIIVTKGLYKKIEKHKKKIKKNF
jgi:hypothetical protein